LCFIIEYEDRIDIKKLIYYFEDFLLKLEKNDDKVGIDLNENLKLKNFENCVECGNLKILVANCKQCCGNVCEDCNNDHQVKNSKKNHEYKML
jgi:hypothetical protein